MRLILDEWVWADLKGENGEGAQRETFRLLQRVFEKCDRLVTVEGSPFLRKYFNMMQLRMNLGDPRRTIVRVVKAQFFQNSEKLQRLQEGSLPDTPAELEHKVKEDDHYLVRAYLAANADLLVTTDKPLMEALSECGIRCMNRDTFISSYLENYLENSPTG
jgi:predicted nucleic acid-binding protein